MSNPLRQAVIREEGSPVRNGPRRLTGGTEQQNALWEELASDSTAHVLVEARAGCGKSSSCREGMWRMLDRRPGLAIAYAVFNRQNAEEFASECPPGVNVGTVHSFGYRALQRSCRSQIEKNKTYLILDECAEGRRLPRYLRRSVAMLVSQAKNQGLYPDQDNLLELLHDLVLHYDINVYGREDWVVDLTASVLSRSARWTELCDFDDMVWLPAVHRLEFPEVDALFLDEVQDWNPAQHQLIGQLCKSGRVIAVGDRYQSIYAFRGADADSIPRLSRSLSESSPGLRELPLTVTWRCPKRHVELARQLVQDIEAHPSAAEGDILHVGQDEAMDRFHAGDMVLCPANAPLVSAALRLIASGRRALVRGRAIGDQLTQVVRAAGDGVRTIADLARGVQDWMGRELARLSDLDGVEDLIESVQDRAAGVMAVLSSCDSPAQVEGRIGELFSDSADPQGNPTAVIFSTVHRAKGLEADNVWLLEVPTRQPRRVWEVQAQRNLCYVALTRSKQMLAFVDLERS